jgi:hypothetical protein
MRTIWLFTRIVLPVIALAMILGGHKLGYGFSTGR